MQSVRTAVSFSLAPHHGYYLKIIPFAGDTQESTRVRWEIREYYGTATTDIFSHGLFRSNHVTGFIHEIDYQFFRYLETRFLPRFSLQITINALRISISHAPKSGGRWIAKWDVIKARRVLNKRLRRLFSDESNPGGICMIIGWVSRSYAPSNQTPNMVVSLVIIELPQSLGHWDRQTYDSTALNRSLKHDADAINWNVRRLSILTPGYKPASSDLNSDRQGKSNSLNSSIFFVWYARRHGNVIGNRSNQSPHDEGIW